MTVFRSRHHPGDASTALVYARALTGPLAWSMTGVMIAAAVSMLEGQDPLPWVVWVVPLVYALSTAWTVHDLRRTPAELVLDGSRGGVRSVWDAAGRANALPLHSVYSPRRTMEGVDVPIGRTLHSFAPGDWPGFERLEAAVFAAANASEQERRTRAAI
ncbi:MAG: hypothetical protein ABJF88_02745 [Rhodothermales bacterium]